MSDEPAATPETPAKAPTKSATRVRRVSNPRPKKVVKDARTTTKPETDESSTAPEAGETVAAAATPVESATTPVESAASHVEERAAPTEPVATEEPALGETPSDQAPADRGSDERPSQNAKRKRRRRKGKGPQNEENDGDESEGEEGNDDGPANPPQRQEQRRRPRVDPELLSKRAWKIFLAEVSEEGVALVGDNDAKELSRRCFRLAEIFLEEQARRC